MSWLIGWLVGWFGVSFFRGVFNISLHQQGSGCLVCIQNPKYLSKLNGFNACGNKSVDAFRKLSFDETV